MAIDKPNENLLWFNVLLNLSLTVELLDNLSSSRHYSHLIRQRANMLLRAIQPVINNDMILLCRSVVDSTEITNIMTDVEIFNKEASLLHLCDFPIIAAIIRMYRDDPQKILSALDISPIPRLPKKQESL